MSAKRKKTQHLTIFLIKEGVKSFADALKENADVGDEIPLNNQKFTGALYLPKADNNSPSWLSFIHEGFPAQQVKKNRAVSALLFVQSEKRIFAITFGHARHFLDPDAYERDFGLRVVVNRVSPAKIRGIRLRVFKETAVKRQEEAAKGTGLRTFGVDIQQDLLRGVTGAPTDAKLATRIGGADSLAVDAPMDFKDLPKKCKKLLAAHRGKEYAKQGFDWIDNLNVVRSPSLIDKLDDQLVDALKAQDDSIQMLCPDTVNRDIVVGFLYRDEQSDSDKHPELEIVDWQAEAGNLDALTVEGLRDCRVRCYDEAGTAISEIAEKDCFVFETTVNGRKYVLSGGEWFEVASTFDDQICKYIKGISKKTIALPDCKQQWLNGKQKERKYVEEAAKAADLMSLHTKNFPIGGDQVEPCDLLHRKGALVHVKIWTQSATFSHLLAQGAISAESLLRYSSFRDHVVACATKHKAEIKTLFPTDGFVTSKLDVVLTLVSKQEKLPFFSRLNLMREGQRIERLGYKVRYQRIEVV
jgi:uncharacterized protein (TIGR04141 family)